ncbi:MAG TPA: hypothetical protein VFE10_07320 [Phenylobacterium sp.]|jgi:hypothetical protein|nr:hypothetical protein [Phenylobacterium sp.]
MIVHLAPSAPWALHAVAAVAAGLHIGGASTGMGSGAVALLAPKGRRLHQVAGTVFFVSMLTMSAVAAVTAPLLPDWVSALMGLFVFYLTATAWMTVQRAPRRVGRLEVAACAVAVAVAVGYFALAVVGGQAPKGLIDGEPSQIGYVFGAVAAIAIASDLRMIRKGGLAGPKRIARHLWRMCAALAIAWGSFAGQPKAQPEALRGSILLILPALLVVAAMIFWLVKIQVRFQLRLPALGRASPAPS